MRKLFPAIFVAVFAFSPMAMAADTPTTNDLIQACDVAVPQDKCLTAYELADADQALYGNPKTCQPDIPSMMSDQPAMYATLRAEVHNVVGWLKQHPEYGTQDYYDGVEAAIRALYPCK